jgi:hypothetical protein
VAEASHQVRIEEAAVYRYARECLDGRMGVPPWELAYHFFDGTQETVSYLLVLDSLNFCFWPLPGRKRWEIDYRSKRLSGYYALAASLKRAVESGIPITMAGYLAEVSLDNLKGILGGRGELQLLEQRVKILNELGWRLLKYFDGEASKLVEAAGGSAVNLARLLADTFTSFRDVANYRGKRAFFYKRAQIFAADLCGAFQGQSWGNFMDICELTAFADYKLPQVLRHLGILHYAPGLSQTLDRHTFLGSGSPEEVEIRANTIWAVELIRQELALHGESMRAIDIDWVLWNLGQDETFKQMPYHRTVTIFY